MRNEKKRSGGSDTAAMIHVSGDGISLTHDPDTDRIRFPGGGTKFTINRCPISGRYLSLVNPQDSDEVWRNRLCLTSSDDLRSWRIGCELLFHQDKERHAFQYVDWVFDGDDIVYVSRTAYDDDDTGAANAHDANYLTFHRLVDYRKNIA
jgi:hypothetical protein